MVIPKKVTLTSVCVMLCCCSALSGTNNIIENGSFEVGFGKWWSRDADFWEAYYPLLVTNHWDSAESYDGDYSCKLYQNWTDTALGGGQRLSSTLYRLESNKTYTVSFWAKSSVSAYLTAFITNSFKGPTNGPGDGAGIEKIPVSTTWSNYTFELTTAGTFTNYPTHTYQFYVESWAKESAGNIWVDAVSLFEGTNTQYHASNTNEVGLFTDALANIFYDDETANVGLRIRNNTDSSATITIPFRVYDYWNRLRSNGSISEVVGATTTVTNTLDLTFSTNNWGPFRIQAWIQNEARTMDEMNFSVLPRPYTEGLDETSRFGNHVAPRWYWLAASQKTGTKFSHTLSVGTQFRWNLIEPTFDSFTWYDDEMTLYTNYGHTVYACLGNELKFVPEWNMWTSDTTNWIFFNDTDPDTITVTNEINGENFTNKFAAGDLLCVVRDDQRFFTNNGMYEIASVTPTTITLNSSNVLFDTQTNRTYMFVVDSVTDTNRGWRHFVREVARHYTNNPTYWEIWTELDTEGEMYWCPTGYVHILTIGYDELKAVNTNNTIVGFASWNVPYFDQVLGNMDTNKVDVLSSHIFSGGEFGTYRLVTNVLHKYNKPGHQTQSGNRSKPFIQSLLVEDINPKDARFTSEEGGDYKWKSEAVIRNLFQHQGSGFSKTFYYDGRSTTAGDYLSTWSSFEWDGTLRPKMTMLSIAAQFIDHYDGLGLQKTLSPDTVSGYMFHSNGVPVLALYGAPYPTTSTVSNYFDAYSLTTTLNPGEAVAYDVVGNPLDIDSGITFGQSPIYIRGVGITTNDLLSGLTVSATTDTNGPNVSLSTWPTGDVDGTNVSFRWLAIDDITTKGYTNINSRWNLNGGDWSAWTNDLFGVVFTTNIPQGNYTFNLEAMDYASNVTALSQDFTVLGGAPEPTTLFTNIHATGKIQFSGKIKFNNN